MPRGSLTFRAYRYLLSKVLHNGVWSRYWNGHRRRSTLTQSTLTLYDSELIMMNNTTCHLSVTVVLNKVFLILSVGLQQCFICYCLTLCRLQGLVTRLGNTQRRIHGLSIPRTESDRRGRCRVTAGMLRHS